ncbi:hypothetical protein J5X84_14175 [Streptosporangiaceae bacterium NEAU-GS5]|nr:hypothetical protein [Streptosporangiaceae bacterium NEAU-GS5]
MRTHVVALLAAAVPLAAVIVIGGCLGRQDLNGSECSEADLALIPTLEKLSVISAHPSQATDEGLRSGCYEDENYPYAGHAYTIGAADTALPYYARLAKDDGWTPIDGADATSRCYGKRIGAARAFLLVTIESAARYSVTVNATHGDVPDDGGLLC